MAFQIKSFASIVASMLNHMRSVQDKLTDFNVGSVARTLVEAPAIEIDELYQQMFHGLKEAIPVAIYTSFSFDRLPAKSSNGLIRVTITSSTIQTVIPAGTVFSSQSTPISFSSTIDTTIPPGGTYADVYVVAKAVGTKSNIAAGVLFTLTPSPAGIVSATNSAKFTNGAALESDDQRKVRFAAYIASLNHGTTGALIYGMKTSRIVGAAGDVTEYVKFSSVYEPYAHDNQQPIAWVRCFIHNGSSGASSALLNRTADIINGYHDANGNPVSGWKAAGVHVDVEAATNLPVNVTAVITPATGYTSAPLIIAVNDAIQSYLFGLDIGAPALKAEIIAAAMSVDGVYNFVMSTPTIDATATYPEKIVPGTIALT